MVESSPPIDEDEIDLLELIRTLIAAWKTIAIITVLCTGISVTLTLKECPRGHLRQTSLLAHRTGEQTSGASSRSRPVRGLGRNGGDFHAI